MEDFCKEEKKRCNNSYEAVKRLSAFALLHLLLLFAHREQVPGPIPFCGLSV